MSRPISNLTNPNLSSTHLPSKPVPPAASPTSILSPIAKAWNLGIILDSSFSILPHQSHRPSLLSASKIDPEFDYISPSPVPPPCCKLSQCIPNHVSLLENSPIAEANVLTRTYKTFHDLDPATSLHSSSMAVPKLPPCSPSVLNIFLSQGLCTCYSLCLICLFSDVHVAHPASFWSSLSHWGLLCVQVTNSWAKNSNYCI